jgi:hypothetical protein
MMEHRCRWPRWPGGGFLFRGGRVGLAGLAGEEGAAGGVRGGSCPTATTKTDERSASRFNGQRDTAVTRAGNPVIEDL